MTRCHVFLFAKPGNATPQGTFHKVESHFKLSKKDIAGIWRGEPIHAAVYSTVHGSVPQNLSGPKYL